MIWSEIKWAGHFCQVKRLQESWLQGPEELANLVA